MKNILSSFFSNMVPQVVLTLIVGFTIATGAITGVKMIKANVNKPDI